MWGTVLGAEARAGPAEPALPTERRPDVAPDIEAMGRAASAIALLLCLHRSALAPEPSPSTLDAALGAGAGSIIAVHAESEGRWRSYASQGLLSGRVERLRGVLGSEVPAQSIALRVRAELAHGRETHEGVGTLGALGCFASHVAAWRAVVRSGAARSLVFEEDALLTAEGVATAASLAAALPSGGKGVGFDVALLGYLRLRGEVEVFEEQRFTAVPMSGPGAGGWLRLRGGFWGTHAYLVTARGAQRLLDSAEPIASQVDAYMGWQAEFDPAFVLLAAPLSLISQGGRALDPPPPPRPAGAPNPLAVQNRQCWKCDLDKWFPGGPVEGGRAFHRRSLLALAVAFLGGVVAAWAGRSLRRRSPAAVLAAVLKCAAQLGICKEEPRGPRPHAALRP